MKTIIRIGLVAVVLLLVFSRNDVMGRIGNAAYENGYYTTAFLFLRPLAEQGDASAQLNLGFMYNTGQGVSQDHVASVKWTRKAAEQGDARAQHELGHMYLQGEGVPQDFAEAAM